MAVVVVAVTAVINKATTAANSPLTLSLALTHHAAFLAGG